MKIRVVIFSYEREQMLKSLIKEVEAIPEATYLVIDDGSSFTLNDSFHQFEHGGKVKYWRLWDYALKSLKDDHSDLFLFIPSDFSEVNFTEIIARHNQFKRTPYAYNVVNDGRLNCWNLVKPFKMDEDTSEVGFTDCGFFCNKATLNKIGYNVTQINPYRFQANNAISSGVGQQLTFRMRRHSISMYMPVKSLAYHGSHDSLMHPNERIKTPLVSK